MVFSFKQVHGRSASHWRICVAATCLCLIIAAITAAYLNSVGTKPSTEMVLSSNTHAKAEYKLETVTASADQTKGLSGRSELSADGGMLFQYENVERRCIWMKDMKFNIDVIWVDENNRITSIVNDLSPGTYPQSYCADAQRVIELKAGEAIRHNLRVGQVITL